MLVVLMAVPSSNIATVLESEGVEFLLSGDRKVVFKSFSFFLLLFQSIYFFHKCFSLVAGFQKDFSFMELYVFWCPNHLKIWEHEF